jgi:hypothetical protein
MNTHLKCEISLRNVFLFADGVYLNNITIYKYNAPNIPLHILHSCYGERQLYLQPNAN